MRDKSNVIDLRTLAERFHAQGALLGLWGDVMPKGVAHVPPAHEMIDPLKDTTALIAHLARSAGRSAGPCRGHRARRPGAV